MHIAMTHSTSASDTAGFALGPWLARNRQALALPGMFAVAVVVFAIYAPGFLTVDNMTNVARQSV